MLRYVTMFILCSVLGNTALANAANEHYQRGVASYEAGQYQKALTAFEEAIRSPTADSDADWLAEAHYRIASAHHALESFEQAISAYKKAIAHNPSSAIIYNALGITYSELKQYEAALRIYRKACQLSDKTAEPHYNIGLVYLKQGMLTRAAEAFKRAIALDAKWTAAYTGPR